MKLIALFIFTVLGINIIQCSIKTYDAFKVFSIYCEKSNIESLKFWEHHSLIDFWSQPGINKTSQVLVDPSLQSEFEEFLLCGNFNYETLIENVGKLASSSIFYPSCFSISRPSKLFQICFHSPLSSRNRKSHTRNKLKFHFQNGNFTDTVDSDFSHYWTLPEVNLEKKIFLIGKFLSPSQIST